jgi:hypothetical protein
MLASLAAHDWYAFVALRAAVVDALHLIDLHINRGAVLVAGPTAWRVGKGKEGIIERPSQTPPLHTIVCVSFFRSEHIQNSILSMPTFAEPPSGNHCRSACSRTSRPRAWPADGGIRDAAGGPRSFVTCDGRLRSAHSFATLTIMEKAVKVNARCIGDKTRFDYIVVSIS